MIHLRGRHWATAMLAAGVVHAGVAAAVLWEAPESGARSAGLGGIEVALGPTGGAPGSEARAVEQITEAETVEPVETAVTERPEPVPTQEPVPLEPTPVEMAEPVVPVEQAVEPVETIKPVEAREVVVPPPPRQKPIPPKPVEVVEPAEVAKPVEPLQEAAAPVRPVPAEQMTAATPSAPGAGGKAGTQSSPEAGSADSASGGGLPGAAADYMSLLQAWLEKHKQYPRRARQRRQEGTVLLYFVMSRDGRVLEHRVQRSSGHPLLDREVEEMIERAQPLPRMPADMARARLEVVVPVQFFLR